MGSKSVERLDIGKGGKRDQYAGKKPDKLGRWHSGRCAALLDESRRRLAHSVWNERVWALGKIRERTLEDDSYQGSSS